MRCRSGWLAEALYVVAAVLALAAGWAGYWLRRQGRLLATLILTTCMPLLLVLAYMLAGRGEGSEPLTFTFLAVLLLAPATLAAWLGAAFGWRHSKRKI